MGVYNAKSGRIEPVKREICENNVRIGFELASGVRILDERYLEYSKGIDTLSYEYNKAKGILKEEYSRKVRELWIKSFETVDTELEVV